MKKIISIILCLIIAISVSSTIFAQTKSSIKIGDVDSDRKITVLDATYIQLYLVNLRTLTDDMKKAADTNQSGAINIFDATIIQQYLIELIDTLPSVPQPKDEQLAEIAEKIKAVQNENTLTLSVLSDVHFNTNYSSNHPTLSNIEKMGQLQNLANVDFVANLGDFVVGNEEKQTTVSSLKTLVDKVEKESDAPVLNVRGNHDDNGWYTYGNYGGSNKPDEIINDKEWHDLVLSNLPDNFVFDKNNPYGGYGYIDHEKSKTRIFMLNSSDIPYIENEDGSYRYNSYTGHAFSDYQLDFVADALHFSDKESPNEWAALFLTHVPLDTSTLDNERFGGKDALIRGHEYMLSIITAYKNGTSFKASGYVNNPAAVNDRAQDFSVSVDVDYSDKGYGEVIAFMSGHAHSNNYTNKAGLKNSLSCGYTFIGTVASESFTNYVIDRDTNTISAFSYGKTFPEKTQGTITSPVDTGSIESGEWSVRYSQFYPNGESIYNGISQIHPVCYQIGTISSKIDLDTLELDAAEQVNARRQLTKAIAIKPFTTYIIPDDFIGDCISFSSDGNKRAFLGAVDHGDYKTITTNIRNYYILFSLDIGLYNNYEDFYIIENHYGLAN